MVARMRLNVTLYVYWLSWWMFNLLVYRVTNKLLIGSTLYDTAFQTFWHRSFTVFITGGNTKPGILKERDNPDWCRVVPWRLYSRKVRTMNVPVPRWLPTWTFMATCDWMRFVATHDVTIPRRIVQVNLMSNVK